MTYIQQESINFAKFIIEDGLRQNESLGNIGIINGDGEYGFSEVLEDQSGDQSIAIQFVSVEDMWDKFAKVSK